MISACKYVKYFDSRIDGLKHKPKDKLIGSEISCIATVDVYNVFRNATFDIKLSIEIIAQARSGTIIKFC